MVHHKVQFQGCILTIASRNFPRSAQEPEESPLDKLSTEEILKELNDGKAEVEAVSMQTTGDRLGSLLVRHSTCELGSKLVMGFQNACFAGNKDNTLTISDNVQT